MFEAVVLAKALNNDVLFSKYLNTQFDTSISRPINHKRLETLKKLAIGIEAETIDNLKFISLLNKQALREDMKAIASWCEITKKVIEVSSRAIQEAPKNETQLHTQILYDASAANSILSGLMDEDLFEIYFDKIEVPKDLHTYGKDVLDFRKKLESEKINDLL